MKIALLPGDGIGPEVTAEAVRILKNVADHAGAPLSFTTHAIGGVAIDSDGAGLPDATLEPASTPDAVLLGAVRTSKFDGPASGGASRGGAAGVARPSVAMPTSARRFATPRWPSERRFNPSGSAAPTC